MAKFDAARIFVSAIAFDTLRASPLRRKYAMEFDNCGTAIAPITQIIATTKIVSSRVKPD